MYVSTRQNRIKMGIVALISYYPRAGKNITIIDLRHMTSKQQCPMQFRSWKHWPRLQALSASCWSLEQSSPEAMHRKLNGTSVVDWLKDIFVQSRWPISWRVGIMVTFWKLWACKNNSIFCGTHHNVDDILSHIRSIVLHSINCFSNSSSLCR